MATAVKPDTNKLTNAAFETRVAELIKHKNNLRSANLEGRWHIGKIVIEVLDDPAKYGQRKLEQLSERVDIEPQTLRQAQQFAKLYDEEGLKRLLKYEHVGWSHVVQLLRIEDPAKRVAHEKALLSNPELSRDKLSEAIDKTLRKGPKKARLPSSPSGALKKLSAATSSFSGTLELVDKTVELLGAVEDEDKREQLTAQKTEIVEAMKKLQEQLTTALATLSA